MQPSMQPIPESSFLTRLSSLEKMSDHVRDSILIKTLKKKPVICASMEPWRAYSAEQFDLMVNEFLTDMEGSIYKHYYTYRDFNYTAEQAYQDAFDALVICLERDSKPVSMLREKGSQCPCCKEAIIPGTKISDEVELRDTNGLVTSDYPSTVSKRSFTGTCDVCGSTWSKTLTKAQFSTLFYGQVRGRIQSTIRNTAIKIPSWDSVKHISNEPSVSIDIETSDEKADDVKFIDDLINRVRSAIANMTPRHAETVNLHVGGRMPNGDLLQQSDIAKLMNISKQRVCSIINLQLESLRNKFTEEEMIMFAKIMRNR